MANVGGGVLYFDFKGHFWVMRFVFVVMTEQLYKVFGLFINSEML